MYTERGLSQPLFPFVFRIYADFYSYLSISCGVRLRKSTNSVRIPKNGYLTQYIVF